MLYGIDGRDNSSLILVDNDIALELSDDYLFIFYTSFDDLFGFKRTILHLTIM